MNYVAAFVLDLPTVHIQNLVMGKRPLSGGAAAKSATCSNSSKRMLSVAQHCAQKLRDNYSKLSPEQTDVITNPQDGLTLRQRLEKDITAAAKGAPISFGRIYHDELKHIYALADSAHKQLQPPSGCRDVCPQLLQAMVALKRNKPDRSPILAFMQTADSLSEAECCGMFRWFTSLRPGCSKIQLPICIKCLEFVARL